MDNPFFIRDNSSKCISELADGEKEAFNSIANKTIQCLLKENENLIVYSNNKKDKIEEQVIFNLDSSYQLETENLVGFFGINDLQINIGSRFSEVHSQQFFIQYMLRKIHKINLFDFNSSHDNTKIWEQLLYFIFPVFLRKAYTQGVFKIYQGKSYNDSNLKGRIEIAKHLRMNVPFIGNVAFSNKEFSYNNPLTHLIRHTIEFISAKGYASIFQNDYQLSQAVQTIKTITPDYSIKDRQKLILKNIKRVNHPFFTEYEPLRKLCIQILNYEGLCFSNNRNKIFGLLIDVAWLWEEYLNTILQDLEFTHPENKTKKGLLYLFETTGEIYPDFYNMRRSTLIDAKYKKLKNKDVSKEDIYQIVTYMYRLQAECGIIIYPTDIDVDPDSKKMNSQSYGGNKAHFIKYGFKIPQETGNYREFKSDFSQLEASLKGYLKEIVIH
jgi:5-methylcytosine-specific restriction endonuclease McrBC regulatory subunit McrC